MTRLICTVAGVLAGAVAAGLVVGLVLAVVWLLSGDSDIVVTTDRGPAVVMVAFGPDFLLPPCALVGAVVGGVLGWRWSRPEPSQRPGVETGTAVRRPVE